MTLPAGFDVARAGLAGLARTGWLLRFPRDADDLPVDGPGAGAASADGALGLAAVVFDEQNPAVPAELPLRWESVVVGGFPFELDASLRIAPAESEGTALSLVGTCQLAPGAAAAAKVFIEGNREALAKDISRGEGETVKNLSSLVGCADAKQVGAALQKNFTVIFPTATAPSDKVVDAILTTLRTPALSCAKLA